MKVILTSVSGLIAYIGCVISCIWAVVEFILYLGKDKIFNWWSVWMIVIFAILSMVMIVVSAYLKQKEQSKIINYRTDLNKKSKFQQKLEEAINRQKENQENQRKNQNQ